ncbi:MAG TPA: class I SAM-dependent methyltransferase, partial [Roseiflexaceae bacterium]|nr:class I SAM-dependent methyltransferase [Roseiflexaceae bacterium]
QSQIEVMTRLVATKRPTVTRFLDLGCGDGILTSALLRRYPAARGVLADVSEQMLGIARSKLQSNAAQLSFLNLNLGNSAWRAAIAPHGPFDVVVSGYAIHHLSDGGKQQVYRAIHDLLAPGGLFINIEYVAAATPSAEDMFADYLIDHVYAAKQGQGDGVSREQVSEAVTALMYTPDDRPAPVEQQCAWLRDIGFSGVDCFFKLFGFAVFGGQRPTR